MDISKIIKFITTLVFSLGLLIVSFIIYLLILFLLPKEPKIKKYNYQHEKINLKNWNLKNSPIDKAVLFSFKKNTDFKFLEQQSKILKISNNYENYKSTSLNFESFPIISTDKDYKLILNDTIVYLIKNIKTDLIIEKNGPRNIDTIYNMIKSININRKDFNFKKPRVFTIPKDSYTVDKK